MLITLDLNHKFIFVNKRRTVYWFIEMAPQALLDILESDTRFVLADEILNLQMPNKFRIKFTNLNNERKKWDSQLNELSVFTSADNISGGNYNSYEYSIKIGGIRYGI